MIRRKMTIYLMKIIFILMIKVTATSLLDYIK